MQEYIIKKFKYYIDDDRYEDMYELYNNITTPEYHNKISYPFIFQKVYLYACIKRKSEVVVWLFNVYKTFALVDRIALRPTIIYGKHLFKDGYPVELSKNIEEY